MKIIDVENNNRTKRITISTKNGDLILPYAKLRLIPNKDNRISEIFVDPELANRAITYLLEDGQEDSVHMDAFLEFEQDPDHTRDMALHNMTLDALEKFEESDYTKSDLAQMLKTSRSQVNRLLDPSNYDKSLDEVLRLIGALGFEVSFKTKKKAA